MAKGPLFLGPISGKVGNVVAYHIKYSADKETQAIRAYVSDVANPKTEPQAIQRMKMAPAVNFYRGLSEILDNAWQGERYGTMSRRYFMSLAMKQDSGIPFIPKGEKRFFPGQYRVSQGSLPTIGVSVLYSYAEGGWVESTLHLDMQLENTSTWGEVSQELISQNFGLQDGDKITLVGAVVDSLGDYFPQYASVVLDVHSTEPQITYTGVRKLRIDNSHSDLLEMRFNNSQSTVAACFVLSRLDAGASAKWLRSNSVMECSQAYLEEWMGAAAYQTALMSYTSADTYFSDWYLNIGIPGNSSQEGGSSSVQVVSVENVVIGALDYQQHACTAAIFTMSDGTRRAARSSSPQPYIAKKTGSGYEFYLVDLWKADAASLSEIQQQESGVSGWLSVEAVVGELPE